MCRDTRHPLSPTLHALDQAQQDLSEGWALGGREAIPGPLPGAFPEATGETLTYKSQLGAF